MQFHSGDVPSASDAPRRPVIYKRDASVKVPSYSVFIVQCATIRRPYIWWRLPLEMTMIGTADGLHNNSITCELWACLRDRSIKDVVCVISSFHAVGIPGIFVLIQDIIYGFIHM